MIAAIFLAKVRRCLRELGQPFRVDNDVSSLDCCAALGIVLAGYFLLAYGYRLPELAIVAVLYRYRAYVHIKPYALWMIWVPLAIEIGRVLVAAFVGSIVGAAAKRSGMAAAMTIGLIFAVPNIMQLSIPAVHRSAEGIFFLPQVVTNLVASVAVVIGAGIVRKSGLFARPT